MPMEAQRGLQQVDPLASAVDEVAGAGGDGPARGTQPSRRDLDLVERRSVELGQRAQRRRHLQPGVVRAGSQGQHLVEGCTLVAKQCGRTLGALVGGVGQHREETFAFIIGARSRAALVDFSWAASHFSASVSTSRPSSLASASYRADGPPSKTRPSSSYERTGRHSSSGRGQPRSSVRSTRFSEPACVQDARSVNAAPGAQSMPIVNGPVPSAVKPSRMAHGSGWCRFCHDSAQSVSLLCQR
jgi:hypothetical protein